MAIELIDFLGRAAQLDAEFIVYDDGFRGFAHSYAEIAQAVHALRLRLRAHGVAKPETVMLWSESRASFNADLQVAGSHAVQERWQKMYFRGLRPSGEAASAEGHRSRIRLKPFADKD